MVNEYLIAAIFMILGNVVATLLPYFRKRYQLALKGEKLSFDVIYIFNTIVAVIVQFLFAMPVIALIDVVDSTTDIIGLIILSFAYGYGGNKAQIEAGKVYNTVKNLWQSDLEAPPTQ